MRNSLIAALACLILLLLAAGCSQREKDARALLEEGQAVRQEKDLDRAEQILARLVRDYPRTEAAAAARGELKALRQERLEVTGRLEDLLERLDTVLAGYRAFAGEEPQSLEDLNRGDYFFDVPYLVGIVPEDLRAYLLVAEARGGYRLWAFDPAYRIAMVRGGGDAVASRADGLSEEALRRDHRVEAVAENVFSLRPPELARHE